MKDIEINNNNLKITLRESLLGFFQDKILKEVEDLNCHYFAHNLIKNYDKPGYTISAFHTNPAWQEEYWQDHWSCDVLSSIHKIAEIDGFAISSWDFVDPGSDVMKRRKLVCNLDDGMQFTFRHEEGILENYTFGWRKAPGIQMSFEKLLKLSDVVSDFRDAHLKLFSAPTPRSFGEKQPGL